MKQLIQPLIRARAPLSILLRNTMYVLAMVMLLSSCYQDNLQSVSPEKSKIARINATEMSEILRLGEIEDLEVTVQSESRISGSGYHAKAKGRGIIPTGEYAGQRFNVTIQALYSGLGSGTLVSGSAKVKIRGEKFESVNSVGLASFCCGEGDIYDLGSDFEFTVYGQVEHVTAPTVHNHLFAGFGSTLGTMNFNVADQTGSVTEPGPGGPPPHDPGIGLIIDIPAHPVSVMYRP